MNAVKKTIAALAVGATAIVPMATSAQAHDRGHRHIHKHHHVHKYNYGPAVRCHERNNFCRSYKKKYVYRHNANRGADVAGAAVLGIIGGALIGSAIANSNKQPRYVAPRPTYRTDVFPPAPTVQQRRVASHGGSLEPWSRGWYQYCDAKYRSFNPQTGTYRGYDGYDHFCVAR